MAKYSTEFKLQAVTEYLEGNLGYDALTRKYNISSSARLREWVATYRKNGSEGIARSRQQKIYYGHTYHGFEELEQAVRQYIEYYNNRRIKERLSWLSPVEYRLRHTVA